MTRALRTGAMIAWGLAIASVAFAGWVSWHTLGVQNSAIQETSAMTLAIMVMVGSFVLASAITALAHLVGQSRGQDTVS